MGAVFEYEIINRSTATGEELQKDWQDIVSRCYHDSGHDSYSGTLKECSGMQVVNLHFPNFNEAYEWLSGNTQKWEEAKVVSYDDVEKRQTRGLTFNGKPANHFRRAHDLSCVIRDYSSRSDFSPTGTPIVFADQLTDKRKDILKRELDKFETLNDAYENEKLEFKALHNECGSFYNTAYRDFSAESWRDLKRLRASLAKTKPKIDKLHLALKERDRKYADSIIKTKTVNNGKKFVVGGWCSC